MADAWSAPAVIISCASLAASMLSLAYTRRVDRRQRSADQPVVNIRTEVCFDEKWCTMTINILNRTDGLWELEEIAVTKPRGIRYAMRAAASKTDGLGGRVPTLEKFESAARAEPLRPGILIPPAGTPRSQISWGDEIHEHVFLSLSSRRTRASIRLKLRALEADARSVTIKVQRHIPAAPSTASV